MEVAREGMVEVRPKNWLAPVILLSLRECDSYGYELLGRTASLGLHGTNAGTLYRTLRQMEEEGLCESVWETSRGGPARRMYSITDAGEAYLSFWAEALERQKRTVDEFFRIYRESSAAQRGEKEPPGAGGGR